MVSNIIEYENGRLTKVRKIPQSKPVEDYLRLQGRFKHLLKKSEELKKVQAVADKNIEYYGLK